MSSLDDINYIIKGNNDNKESKKLLVDFSIHNSEWSVAREKLKVSFNLSQIVKFVSLWLQ